LAVTLHGVHGIDATMEELDDAFVVRKALSELPEECPGSARPLLPPGPSHRTIGDALKIPAGTIASRISRCLARLRERLAI
jgi:DNA-directed RNA polymerase specialized sigma24 family protein